MLHGLNRSIIVRSLLTVVPPCKSVILHHRSLFSAGSSLGAHREVVTAYDSKREARRNPRLTGLEYSELSGQNTSEEISSSMVGISLLTLTCSSERLLRVTSKAMLAWLRSKARR